MVSKILLLHVTRSCHRYYYNDGGKTETLLRLHSLWQLAYLVVETPVRSVGPTTIFDSGTHICIFVVL